MSDTAKWFTSPHAPGLITSVYRGYTIKLNQLADNTWDGAIDGHILHSGSEDVEAFKAEMVKQIDQSYLGPPNPHKPWL